MLAGCENISASACLGVYQIAGVEAEMVVKAWEATLSHIWAFPKPGGYLFGGRSMLGSPYFGKLPHLHLERKSSPCRAGAKPG